MVMVFNYNLKFKQGNEQSNKTEAYTLEQQQRPAIIIIITFARKLAQSIQREKKFSN